MTHQQMFGSALWLGCDGCDTPYIRAAFDAPDAPKGKITICGLGYFELYLNGERVSDDLFVPVTSDYSERDIPFDGQPFDEEFAHRCYCLEYPLDALLKAGKNELAVALGPGFFATPTWGYDTNVRFGPVRLCYRMELTGADGETLEILSGADAKWQPGNVVRDDFFKGEEIDLRLHGDDWTTADFSGWQPVSILEPLETDYQLQDCPADKIIRYTMPRLVAAYPDRRIYDAGENLTGWVLLKDRAQSGERVSVCFSEGLTPFRTLDKSFAHGQFFDYISDGRGRTVHPRFTWNGFRYFSVSGDAEPLSVAVIHSDLPRASAFRCSHPVMNWFHDTYIHTQLCNSHGGIPSDCPHIERRGYTGDGQLCCESALLTLNHQAFLRKWLRDISDCQDRKSGHVQYTAPYTRCGGGPGGWGCAIITVPLNYYRHFGDSEPLKEMYGGMREYICYLHDHSDDGLVTRDRPGEWCLGDWCPPGKVVLPEPFVNTCVLIRSLNQLEEIEAILGMETDPVWAEYRAEAVSAVNAAYFDPETGDYARGVQGANAFAIEAGLGDERTVARLIERYRAADGFDTGIFGTPLVVRTLFEHGAADAAYRLLASDAPASYGAMMNAGATTLWEYWPCDNQRSLSHPMFGAAVAELYHHVLGFAQVKGGAGWTRIVIEPKLTAELPSAEGFITTPQGRLAVSYIRRGGRLEWTAEIPEGTEAVLCLDGKTVSLQPGVNRG